MERPCAICADVDKWHGGIKDGIVLRPTTMMDESTLRALEVFGQLDDGSGSIGFEQIWYVAASPDVTDAFVDRMSKLSQYIYI